MKNIGSLFDQIYAERFIDYLTHKGIDAELRQDSDSQENAKWEVWVHYEEDISLTASLFEKYIEEPDNPIYLESAKLGKEIQKKKQKENEIFRKKQINLRKSFAVNSQPKATYTIIAICAIFFIMQSLKINMFPFYYSQYTNPSFVEVRSGEIWRIFTPSFLHGGFIHILFNMMWLLELGRMVEIDKGKTFFVGLVLLLAGLANTGQYLASGPMFLGMSGVVYGLFGFVWMKTKFEYNSNYFLNNMTILFLLIWFFLCIFGIIGMVANTNHGVGLGTGMICGFLSTHYIRNISDIKKIGLKGILVGLLPFLFVGAGIAADMMRH